MLVCSRRKGYWMGHLDAISDGQLPLLLSWASGTGAGGQSACCARRCPFRHVGEIQSPIPNRKFS